jgi:MoaA/NifB/PqqE/SkfB family radical SAM enzyme
LKLENIDLNNIICIEPFVRFEILKDGGFFCCPSWLNEKILWENNSLKDTWFGENAQEIRKSITDGSYKYCSIENCRYLNKLVKKKEIQYPFYSKRFLPDDIIFENDEYKPLHTPSFINFNFDNSCNFKCPSCRKELMMNKVSSNNIIESIDNDFSRYIKKINVAGGGDPFASPSYLKFLRNFDPKKYENLELITLHTNGSLWTEKMWNTVPNIHPYVKKCEISIDAGTRYTYENIIRINGNWDKLIKNLKFIKTIETIEKVIVSFVVQQQNYHEMMIFADTMKEILGRKCGLYFSKIVNWGTYADEEFTKLKIWDSNHPEYQKFIDELIKVKNKHFIDHNMYELVGSNTKLV